MEINPRNSSLSMVGSKGAWIVQLHLNSARPWNALSKKILQIAVDMSVWKYMSSGRIPALVGPPSSTCKHNHGEVVGLCTGRIGSLELAGFTELC